MPLRRFAEPEREIPLTPPWHALAPDAVLRELGSSADGLTEHRAAEVRAVVGPNVLPTRRPPGVLDVLLHQFRSPLIYILFAAAAVALVLGDLTDAGFILAVVFTNAALGTWQEWRAEQSAASLQALLHTFARVTRDGIDRRVDADALVPGDVIALESGDRVPADVRMLRENRFTVDEAFLTGESAQVEKLVAPLPADTPVSERRNIAFAGALVMSGRATAVVVATGRNTEVGHIAATVASTQTTKPPLILRMEKFARQISYAVVAACAVLAVVALLRGMPWLDVFFLAVALAVSAIPEGLPVAMTVALSIATRRMAARRVIVRRLTAVEGLGSCTFIGSDKTGTLTVNKQTVRRLALPGGPIVQVSGEGYAGDGELSLHDGGALGADSLSGPGLDSPTRTRVERLAYAAVLCNEGSLWRDDAGAWQHRGDAVDVALLALGFKAGFDPSNTRAGLRITAEIPFESERSYAALFHERDGESRVAVKGAFEVLTTMCTQQLGANGEEPLDQAAAERALVALSSTGHRVIAVADGTLALETVAHRTGTAGAPATRTPAPGELPLRGLTLLGLVGLMDPPRPEAVTAVAQCHRAGVGVAMITGDHPATALAIAREVGIASSDTEALTGRELTALGDPAGPDFTSAVERTTVFARVSPLQKLHIVEALERLGHFVAVTGDGVNDAPALRRAHIGVAMGSGADVAKDTAAIIVADDNFASIEAGIEEGRFAYDNVRKVTYLVISTGAAEVMLFTLSLVAGLPLPLLPVQILWLNLVTNGIQDVALAFEQGESNAMARPPRRPTEGIFNQQMVRQTIVSAGTMAILIFANWVVLLEAGFDEVAARDRLLLLFVILQNYHVFNCRSEAASAFSIPIRRNWLLVAGVLAAQGLHILAMHVPVTRRVLQLEPISLVEWFVPFTMASVILVVMELFKWTERRRPPAPAPTASR